MLEPLTAALAKRRPISIVRPRHAAILLPLIGSCSNDLSLLLTRRSDTLSSHSGQVAFPGGRSDEGDLGPAGTAMREAYEEIGLLERDISILGTLDDLPSFKNDTAVTPIVARVSPDITIASLTPSRDEVSRIFSIPLRELCDGAAWEVEDSNWRGRPISMYEFKEYDGERLWGLSAYATLMMLALLPESTAPVPSTFTLEGDHVP